MTPAALETIARHAARSALERAYHPSLIATAHHEAGHAIVAYSFGWPILTATVSQGDGLLGYVRVDAPDSTTALQAAAFKLAGLLAEAMLTDGTDTNEVGAWSSDLAAVHLLAESAKDETLRTRAITLASATLKRRWPQVKQLATALIDRLTLTGTDVAKLLPPRHTVYLIQN